MAEALGVASFEKRRIPSLDNINQTHGSSAKLSVFVSDIETAAIAFTLPKNPASKAWDNDPAGAKST